MTLLRPPCPWLAEPASRMIDQGTDQTPVRVGHIGILLYLSTLSRSRILNLAEVRRHDRDDRSGPLQRTAPSPRGARRRRAQTDRSRAPRRLRTARRGQGRGLLRGKRADRLREPPVGGSCHPPGAGRRADVGDRSGGRGHERPGRRVHLPDGHGQRVAVAAAQRTVRPLPERQANPGLRPYQGQPALVRGRVLPVLRRPARPGRGLRRLADAGRADPRRSGVRGRHGAAVGGPGAPPARPAGAPAGRARAATALATLVPAGPAAAPLPDRSPRARPVRAADPEATAAGRGPPVAVRRPARPLGREPAPRRRRLRRRHSRGAVRVRPRRRGPGRVLPLRARLADERPGLERAHRGVRLL